jgi:hypothetical protein
MRIPALFLLMAGALLAQTAGKAMLYVGAWPGKILAIEEGSYTIQKEIPLKTGSGRNVLLSHDKKKLIVTTMKDSGIEIIDLAKGEVVEAWALNQGNRMVRLNGLALDPTDKLLYALTTTAVKKIDRFEIGKPEFMVIDLAQKKIVKTAPFPSDQVAGARSQFRVSPDGRSLYQFGENIVVFDTTTFQVVETIELSKPQYPGMESIFLQPVDDPHDVPGMLTGVFNTTDPVVHRGTFGIAQLDLNKRTFTFTPVGPSVMGMTGLRVTPDRKMGYTVAILGTHGDRRCEFWSFDMEKKNIVKRGEFAGRTRFQFSMSSSGKDLIIYGAGNNIEIYDAETMKLKKDLDVNADMTTPLVVVMSQGGA